MRIGLFIFIVTLSLRVNALEVNRQEIETRIKPIGQVQLTKNDPALPQTKTMAQAIYEQYCSVCHQDGLAGAPKFRVQNDWQSRVNNRTIHDLVASAVKGLNAMPMKGTCTQCSEEDIKNAIQFMLPPS